MSKHQNFAFHFLEVFQEFASLCECYLIFVVCVKNECVHYFLQNIEEMGWIGLFLTEIWPTLGQN